MRSRRTLRRGASGERVRWLQESLRRHGYDVGEPDGYFGYVTEDALLRFQRDHRLRADGIVGSRTIYALQEAPVVNRGVHVVRKGERLGDIARLYDVQLSALRWMNGLKPNAVLRPGRRIVLWRPFVLVSPHPGANPHVIERTIRPYGRSISGLVAPSIQCFGDGSITEIPSPEYMQLAKERNWDFFVSISAKEGSLASVMIGRRSRRRFFEELKQLAAESAYGKYFVDFGTVPLGGGAQVSSLGQHLRRILPGAAIIVSVPPIQRGWRSVVSGFDASQLARHVDRIVLNLHHWERLLNSRGNPLGFDIVERWIAEALREIPPWKVWLGIPMDGCRVGRVDANDDEPVTYRQAIIHGMREGARPRVDAAGFLSMDTEAGVRYILQGRDSLARFLQLALRFKLSGIYFHSIGGEDRRLWDLLVHRIHATSSFCGVERAPS